MAKFAGLLLTVVLLYGSGNPGQNINTGARRKVGGPACTVPTLNYKWSAFDTANDCGGSCTNGAFGNTQNDSISGNTATFTHNSSFNNAVYTTGAVNSLPAWQFSLNQAATFSTLPNTGTLTAYAVLKPNCSTTRCAIMGPAGGNGLEWYVTSSNQIGLDWAAFATIVHANTVSSSVYSTQAFTFDFSVGTAVMYACSGWTCTSQGTGTNHQAPQNGFARFGTGGTSTTDLFNGFIAEWGYRTSNGSLSDIAAWSQCKYGI